MNTSLARGTRPWTVVTTDQANVDMLRTTVSETPTLWKNLKVITNGEKGY